MAVRLRLKRMGRRKRPFFRLVAMDQHTRRDGMELERLGWYDPLSSSEQYNLKADRIIHWLTVGAQPSDTVKNLMSKSGINLRWHLMRSGKSEKEIEVALKDWEKERQEQRKREEAARKQAEREGKETGKTAQPATGISAEPATEEVAEEESVKEPEVVVSEEVQEATAAGAEMDDTPSELSDKVTAVETEETDASEVDLTEDKPEKPVKGKAPSPKGKKLAPSTEDESKTVDDDSGGVEDSSSSVSPEETVDPEK